MKILRGGKKDTQVLQVIAQRSRFNLEAVIDIKRFSNFRRLLRVTVLCLRFVRNLRIKAKGLKVEILKLQQMNFVKWSVCGYVKLRAKH